MELYSQCLTGLLGKWAKQKNQPQSSVELSPKEKALLKEKVSFLAHIAWELFVQSKEQFAVSEVTRLIEAYDEALPAKNPLKVARRDQSSADILEELCQEDGILIEVGKGEDVPLMFLHLTFHEYLAACVLAQRKDWRDVALRNVYDSRWQEVLRLLGGVLEKRSAIYVAALLRENKNDLFCRPFQLAVFAAAEAHPNYSPRSLLSRLLELAIDLCFHPPPWWSKDRFTPLVVIWGARAMSHLLWRLESEDSEIRSTVVKLLDRMRLPDTLPHLLHRLKNDEDPWVRARAAEVALDLMGETQSIPTLLQWLNEGGEKRIQALEMLGQIGSADTVPHLLPHLGWWFEEERAAAIQALGKIWSAETVPQILSWLEDEHLANSVREARTTAVQALEAIGLAHSARDLQREDESCLLRAAIAIALGQNGSADALPHLLLLLKDMSAEVRKTAAWALGQIRSAEAIPHLLCRVENEVWQSVRIESIKAIGRIGSIDALPHLLSLLEDKDSEIRETTAETLGRIGSPDAVLHLMRRLAVPSNIARWQEIDWDGEIKLESIHVHRAVVEALGRIGSPDAVPHLMRRLEDESEVVVHAKAMWALGQIGFNLLCPTCFGGWILILCRNWWRWVTSTAFLLAR